MNRSSRSIQLEMNIMKMKMKVTTQRVNLALLGLTAFCAAGLFTARMDSAKAEF